MKTLSLIAGAAALAATSAFADGHASGDAAAGDAEFKKCASCHVIADGDNVLGGRGKTGPNLFGLPGRVAGADEDFGKKYGKDLVAAGEAGLVWDEEQFVTFVADPRKFLQAKLDDKKARSKMSFKLRDAEDAANIWAYIASVSPAPTN